VYSYIKHFLSSQYFEKVFVVSSFCFCCIYLYILYIYDSFHVLLLQLQIYGYIYIYISACIYDEVERVQKKLSWNNLWIYPLCDERFLNILHYDLFPSLILV
jgi:hypothetical protein